MEYKKFLKKQLKEDKEFKKEYDKLENKYYRINKNIDKKLNITKPKQINS